MIDENSEELSGCLIIEYYKQENSDKTKWKGGFKLVWSVSSKENSLVTVINSDTSAGKLILDSSIYVVSSIGNIKHKEEGKSYEITDDSGLSNYFPKEGTSIKNGSSEDYWGFEPKITNICKKTSECSGITEDKTTTHKKWTWSKKASGGSSITDWSSNFDTWFKNLFNDSWNTAKEALKKLKGTWSLES